MKYILPILMLALTILSCEQQTKGTTVEGSFPDAANLQVYFDEVQTGDKTTILSKVQADANGAFNMTFTDGLREGIYRLKIGRQEIDVVFDGNEKLVKFSGQLDQMKTYNINVEGSQPTTVLSNTMKSLFARELKLADVTTFIDTVSNAYVASLTAMKAVPVRGEVLDVHKKAVNKLALAHPNAELTKTYQQAVGQAEQAYLAKKAAEKIKVGQVAPEIAMEDPQGKKYALSDLRGKVVLLDFWASWCGPCRRANPNVVALYDKYKDQGFTIFSVSLDGPRRTQGLSDAQLEEAFARSKQKWIAAIEKDQLKWPYHVSDLGYWQAAPAREYGVSSIPKTFLIDKEGVIVQTGVNPMSGMAKLEQDIRSLL